MNSGDFLVRLARIEDLAALSSFQIAMAMESEGFALAPDVVTQGIESVLLGSGGAEYYLLDYRGQSVACCMTQLEWSDWRAKSVLWLHSVYVVPEFRKRGCFRRLYEFLQNKVENDTGLAGIRLYVDKTNHQAEQAYRQMGMSDDHYKLFEWLKAP